GHPFARLTELPGRPERPEPWLLGSSPQSGIWAAQLGLPYVFADFINPAGAEIAARYRAEFTPSGGLEAPRAVVAVWAVCADTDEEARRLASSAEMMMALLFRGQLVPVPSVKTALRFLAEQGPAAGLPRARRAIVGSPDTVREGIEAVAREYGADEVMVVSILHDSAERMRSYERIAAAFGLK
ncbi:MAG TPA: LLM class flavin-dependent oxidoreductase, partial [Longimicrobiaceae bacterium]